jgi:glycosyltransferase involved in cell wall biosynthesis
MNATDKPRIMFLSEMCILDRNSGAAISMHAWLKLLAREGWSASSVTMSLFDGTDEYPFRKDVVPQIDPAAHVGKRIRLNQDGIEHNIYNAGTSVAKKLPAHASQQFQALAAEDIRRIRPDIVIGFGGKTLIPLRRLAKELGAQTVFYLANGSYTEDRRDYLEASDAIVTNSVPMRDLYRDRFGVEAHVIGSYLPDYADVARPTARDLELRRQKGFVTIINPGFVKGGLMFMQIAAMMQKAMPAVTFMAVESRMTHEQMTDVIRTAKPVENIFWVPRQRTLHRVYARSSAILMPSLWFEAAGRVAAEAQIYGLPVLAHRVGGLAEQLNGGGVVFDVPERMAGRYDIVPTPEETLPWVNALRRLLEDPRRYAEVSRKALAASEPFRPEHRAREIVGYFAGLLPGQRTRAEVA